MNPILQDYSKNLKATGEVEQINLGAYSYCFFLQSSGSFQWSLDGSHFLTGYQGLSIGPFQTAQRLYFKAANGLTNDIVVYVSNMPVSYFPNQRIQGTYAKGTKIDHGTLPDFVTDGVTPPGAIFIPGVDSGRQRKQIVFTTNYDASGLVAIAAANGKIFCVVTVNSPLTFETNADFWAYSGNSEHHPNLIVGEIYYSN